MNSAGASAKPTFVYESFARRRSRPARTMARWSNASSGVASTGCQRVSVGSAGSTSARARGRGTSSRAATRSGGGPVRRASRAARGATAPGRRPSPPDGAGSSPRASRPGRGSRPDSDHAPGEGLDRTLPEQHLQAAVAHLQDDGERDVRGRFPVHVFACELRTLLDSSPRFSLHGRKLAEGARAWKSNGSTSSWSAQASPASPPP